MSSVVVLREPGGPTAVDNIIDFAAARTEQALRELRNIFKKAAEGGKPVQLVVGGWERQASSSGRRALGRHPHYSFHLCNWTCEWLTWFLSHNKKFSSADAAWWLDNEKAEKWLKNYGVVPDPQDPQWLKWQHSRLVNPTDLQLSRWLRKHSTLVKRKGYKLAPGQVIYGPVPDADHLRVYQQFDEPHLHKTFHRAIRDDKGKVVKDEDGNTVYEVCETSHNCNLNGDGRIAQGGDGGTLPVPRRSMHAKRQAIENWMIGRLSSVSGGEEPKDFTPIREGMVDPLWCERRIEPAPHHTPNLECFSNPWGTSRRKKEEGGYGGGGAPPANKHVGQEKIKDFKPAELPSESLQQLWEDILNAVGNEEQKSAKANIEGDPRSSYAEHWEARSIWPQDRNGKMTGTKAYEEPRTTQLRRMEELDARMVRMLQFKESEMFKCLSARKEKGATDYELRLILANECKDDELLTLMDFGLTSSDAGRREGLKRNSMNQRKRRDGLNRRRPVISQAINNSKPQEEGWYIVVKMNGRTAYLVKLDMPTEPTDEEYDFSIWAARHEETMRLFVNKVKEIGRDKLLVEDSLAEEGKEVMKDLRTKVREAFDKGMVFYFDENRTKVLQQQLVTDRR